MLRRTENALTILNGIISQCRELGVQNIPLLEGVIAQYVAVIACSEIEETVKDIVTNRLNEITDADVAHLISKSLPQILKRIPKSDLAETASYFGEKCRDEFSSKCEQSDLSSYANLIEARHNTAHPGSSNISIADAEKGLKAAQRILTAFEASI